MHGFRRLALIAIAVTMTMSFAVGCSDKTQESARETADALGEDADRNAEQASDELEIKAAEGQARLAAEDLRARIKANATAATAGPRSMVAITESSTDVTGAPAIVGATDADGDGLDDDGKVQVDIDGASACVTLPANGDDTTVQGGAC
jgi:hypothetical protein